MLIVVDIIGKTFHHSLAAIRSKPSLTVIFPEVFLYRLPSVRIYLGATHSLRKDGDMLQVVSQANGVGKEFV